TIARAMRLNEDLAEAIALGHDLGHTPFGHGGEAVLKEIYSQDFSHNEQSLRVVDLIENNGKGLNLTREVRDGILKHSKGYGSIIPNDPEEHASTVEGRILRVADIIAYLNHDLDDAIRSGVISPDQVPESCLRIVGRSHSERANTMIRDIISSSKVVNGELCILISDELFSAMTTLREFLYEKVYRSPQVHNEFVKAKKILSDLYIYFLRNEKILKKKLEEMEMLACYNSKQPRERIVCDFIASMTDRYALNLYEEIFFPMPIV
ncbi:MAG: HD domain-containing protein, partial [Proteobacteria bacterium]|nr:HD domain-containing protein [Pseudomonadota bacterium]